MLPIFIIFDMLSSQIERAEVRSLCPIFISIVSIAPLISHWQTHWLEEPDAIVALWSIFLFKSKRTKTGSKIGSCSEKVSLY